MNDVQLAEEVLEILTKDKHLAKCATGRIATLATTMGCSLEFIVFRYKKSGQNTEDFLAPLGWVDCNSFYAAQGAIDSAEAEFSKTYPTKESVLSGVDISHCIRSDSSNAATGVFFPIMQFKQSGEGYVPVDVPAYLGIGVTSESPEEQAEEILLSAILFISREINALSSLLGLPPDLLAAAKTASE